MLTITIGVLYLVSINILARVVFTTLVTILQTLNDIHKNQRITGNFGPQLRQLTVGGFLFIGAVILTLIRYGIFKV